MSRGGSAAWHLARQRGRWPTERNAALGPTEGDCSGTAPSAGLPGPVTAVGCHRPTLAAMRMNQAASALLGATPDTIGLTAWSGSLCARAYRTLSGLSSHVPSSLARSRPRAYAWPAQAPRGSFPLPDAGPDSGRRATLRLGWTLGPTKPVLHGRADHHSRGHGNDPPDQSVDAPVVQPTRGDALVEH
jgi:hypothetical protein